jgi:S1-C subfamily serine protease
LQKNKDGVEYLVTKANISSDWAFVNANSSSNLRSDPVTSASLSVGTQIFTLGFPFGLGVSKNGISPMYADFTVSSSGINNNGFINISGRSFDHGNSGGPVFHKVYNDYVVVGIISAGLGSSQGIIIPISRIH